jgi:hypothetical protein
MSATAPALPLQPVTVKNVTAYSFRPEGPGKPLKSFTEGRWNAMIESFKEEHPNETAPVPERVCTFVTYEAATPAGFEELAPDADVQCSLFNRGASLKQLNELRVLMEDEKFEAPGTPYDLKDVINRETERRAATPEDKIKKLLSDLDPDALTRVMNALMEQQTQPRA